MEIVQIHYQTKRGRSKMKAVSKEALEVELRKLHRRRIEAKVNQDGRIIGGVENDWIMPGWFWWFEA